MKNFIALFNKGKERLPDMGTIHWLSYSIRKGKFCERILREHVRRIFKKEDEIKLKPKELDEIVKEIIKISQGKFLDEKRKYNIR